MTPQPAEQLETFAVGTIGPATRIASGELEERTVEELAHRLQGDEFYGDIGELGPNAAGGTFSLVIADALTTNRFNKNRLNAKDHAKALFSWLDENCNTPEFRRIIPRICIDGRLPVEGTEPNNGVVGGHDDEDSEEGCGAQKRLGDILGHIAHNGNSLREFAAGKGISVDDTTHHMIVSNAAALIDSDYVVPGAQIRQAYVETVGEESVMTLRGKHGEVAAGISIDPEKSLDRERLAEVFGENCQAFGMDVSVFPAAAKAISEPGNETEAWQKYVAMLYYNEATSAVLPHPSLRVVVHTPAVA